MTSSTTIKFPESTSKYGQGDTVEIHRQTETQIIRLCHVTQSLDVGGWRVAFVAFRLCFTSFQWLSYVCSAWSNFLARSCGTYFVSFKVSSTGFSSASSPYQLCHRWDFGGWSRPWRAAENSSGTRKEMCCLTDVLLNTTFSWMFSPYQGDNKPSYMTARFQEFNVGFFNFTWKNSLVYNYTTLYREKTCRNILRGSKIGLLGCVIVDGKQERVPFLEFRFNLGPETSDLSNRRFWKKDFEDEKHRRYFWTKVQYNRCRCRTLNISCPFWLAFFLWSSEMCRLAMSRFLAGLASGLLHTRFFFHAKDVMFEL